MLEWVCFYLESDEDIIVPVKKMWNAWHADHPQVTLEDFSAAVLADPRFKAERGVDHNEGMEWMSPQELLEYQSDMESMGYFSGPRLRLASREITPEHIVRMLKKHNDRMEWALEQARRSMPNDLPEPQEGMLIDAIEKAKLLRKGLRNAGLEESQPD